MTPYKCLLPFRTCKIICKHNVGFSKSTPRTRYDVKLERASKIIDNHLLFRTEISPITSAAPRICVPGRTGVRAPLLAAPFHVAMGVTGSPRTSPLVAPLVSGHRAGKTAPEPGSGRGEGRDDTSPSAPKLKLNFCARSFLTFPRHLGPLAYSPPPLRPRSRPLRGARGICMVIKLGAIYQNLKRVARRVFS